MVALAEFIDELGRTAIDLMQFSDKEEDSWYYTIGCILGNPERANVHRDGTGVPRVQRTRKPAGAEVTGSEGKLHFCRSSLERRRENTLKEEEKVANAVVNNYCPEGVDPAYLNDEL